MKFVTYAESIHDINLIHNAGLDEVIISNKELSRLSKVKDIIPILKVARELKLKTVLEWDILLVDQDFMSSVEEFKKIPQDLYDCIRVQDVGILEFVLQHTSLPIQFIVETGNHNLLGLKKWVSYIGARLDRLVLSIELNKDTIKHYCSELECPIELLVLGRVLLFYSPRKLLSNLFEEDVQHEYLQALGESEESPHKGFPLVENKHGTFMFHVKDLFLLDKYTEISKLGIDFLRIDLRHLSNLNLLNEIVATTAVDDNFLKVKTNYPHDVIRGYYQINKSDVLFKKLKNYRIQRTDNEYIGEVIEIVKSDYMAINIRTPHELKIDDQLKFITPEGKEYLCKVHFLKDLSMTDVDSRTKDEIALINYMGGVWPKSQVYRI